MLEIIWHFYIITFCN
jgi:hypothetical protein